jgi:hypothetical protein
MGKVDNRRSSARYCGRTLGTLVMVCRRHRRLGLSAVCNRVRLLCVIIPAALPNRSLEPTALARLFVGVVSPLSLSGQRLASVDPSSDPY